MPGWARYNFGERVVVGWYSLSAKVMRSGGGVLAVDDSGV